MNEEDAVLYLYLATSGNVVQVPEGEEVIDDGGPEIRVVDADGRVLVIFKRESVGLFSRRPIQPSCAKS